MELFSTPWWSALLAIVLIDLVLAGDNAIVIALAARNLPPHLQKKAVMWGTVGAIVVRSVMTVGVVWLLQIPGLMLAGGLGLLWIAYKLLADQSGDEHDGPVASTFWGAMKTIVVADALMGVDNVLGVAGAAQGSFDLVVIGLLIGIWQILGSRPGASLPSQRGAGARSRRPSRRRMCAGISGRTGDGGPAKLAKLSGPRPIAAQSSAVSSASVPWLTASGMREA